MLQRRVEERNITKSPDRIAILEKIDQYERDKRFDEDVEDDPPTRQLMPDEVDYLRKKVSSKVMTKFAFASARRFVNKLLKTKQLVIKNIVGIENFRNLKSGAIITCNHFNAFDSFAIQIAYDQSKHKKRKFYRVIREGNYTNFPGFYGLLMKNCRTLPLSSNLQTMKKFIRATDDLLKNGHFVLVYPEQSLWWNYRKPKPLKDGAFKFAARNNVPVLPCFITMEDSDRYGEDGFPIQEYTIHISKPIYPLEETSIPDNIEYLKNSNYKLWKDIYEDFYKTPLVYLEKEEIK